MTGSAAPAAGADTSPLLQAFDRQQAWCLEPAPFTARVLGRSRRWLAGDADAHAALSAVALDPRAAAVPLRWVGALHHLALRGRQPWAGLWPPAGLWPTEFRPGVSVLTDPQPGCAALSDPALDASLDQAIAAAWRQEQPALCAALARPPQTNEVQRSAALLPGLLHVAAATALPLVLLEIGASAGLNLWCERWRYDHGTWGWGVPASPLTLRSDWTGPAPPGAATPLRIVRRAGCDAHPIDLGQPDESLRLASFIWPEQSERLVRLRTACGAAARWAADEGVAVQGLRASAFVEHELQALPPGAATVLMHSVVWQYIPSAEQAAIRAALAAAAKRASAASPLAWLRFEPSSDEGNVSLRCSLWPRGEDRLLARAHPHGQWIAWQDAAAP